MLYPRRKRGGNKRSGVFHPIRCPYASITKQDNWLRPSQTPEGFRICSHCLRLMAEARKDQAS